MLNRFYLRPPKKQGAQHTPDETPLGRYRKALLGEWIDHATDEHGYPSERGAALATFKCLLCGQYIRHLHETEEPGYQLGDTPENTDDLTKP